MLEKLPYLLMLFPIITLHEYAHAWMAHRCGDDTAKDQGRMNLNPISHIDLFGSVILPIINVSFGGTPLGFGKTVPVDRYQFQHPRRDDILVALAGPVANFLLAFIVLLLATVALPAGHELLILAEKFAQFAVFLGFFNLLPFPPMDGWTLCKTIFKLPDSLEQRIGPWWILIILVCINLPPLQFALNLSTHLVLSLIRGLLSLF